MVEIVGQFALDFSLGAPVRVVTIERLRDVFPAGFDPDALGRLADDDVVGGDVRLDDAPGTDDGVFADLTAGTDHRIEGDPGVVLDDRVVVIDPCLVDDVVVVAIELSAVGD